MAERSGVAVAGFVSSASLFTTPSSISGPPGAADSLYELHQLVK